MDRSGDAQLTVESRSRCSGSGACAGYQAQKEEDEPWVVWWYFSDTLWAWESDLFQADEAKTKHARDKAPVVSTGCALVPGQRTVKGQIAAVHVQHAPVPKKWLARRRQQGKLLTPYAPTKGPEFSLLRANLFDKYKRD